MDSLRRNRETFDDLQRKEWCEDRGRECEDAGLEELSGMVTSQGMLAVTRSWKKENSIL